jgi:hypothetical protein
MAVEEIQYSTSKQWVPGSGDANIVGEIDKLRIAAYDLYDGIYHNRQESLKVFVRGEDQLPIYMPSGKKIIEATSRYLMVGFDYFANGAGEDDDSPEVMDGDTAEAATTVEGYMKKLFKREKIKSKFANQKRYGLIRGDTVWYLTADPKKPQGERLSVHELDPRQYFPIDDPNDNTRVVGCHIVDLVQDPTKPDDKTAKAARRQTYRKELNEDGTLRAISSERTVWEIGKWDDRVLAQEELNQLPDPNNDVPKFDLPPGITSIPTYHIKNNQIPNSGFGMSELSGMETLIFAINQSITDEDLTMIMQGLGMYTTNAAPPQNEDGSVGDWNVGPGQVIELGTDQEFTRVTGVTDVSPYQDHIKILDDSLQQGSGTPEIAVGAVDVAIAESGIALMLQMGPILAKNAEKELEWVLTHDQMFYDIVNMWLPAYEAIQPNGASVVTIIDDPMPVNRDAKIQELILLYTSGVITLAMVVRGLMDLGYDFPEDDPQLAADAINAEQKQKSIDMMGDPYAGGLGGVGEEDPNADPASAGVIDAGMT